LSRTGQVNCRLIYSDELSVNAVPYDLALDECVLLEKIDDE